MKPAKKKDKEVVMEEKPLSTTKKKRALKPWILEYMIIDESVLLKNSWFHNAKPLNVWIKDPWLKFLSLEHALKELNKIARTDAGIRQEPVNTHWRYAGKKFRLLNQDTDEIIDLTITEKEIYAERKT